MDLKKTIRTKLLTEEETLKHRLVVAQSGHKWACECCKFEEPSVIAWTPANGGDIRLTCLECHPYEDPWRYEQEVAIAWMPLHTVAWISHLVRLIAMTRKMHLAAWTIKEVGKTKDSNAEMTVFLEALLDASRKHTGKDNQATVVDPESGKKINPPDPLVAPLQEAIEAALISAGADISKGIEAAALVFKGVTFHDIVSAMEVGPKADRELMVSGVRFIPKSFSSARVNDWSSAAQAVKESLLSELIAVSKLEREYSAVAATPPVGPADIAIQPADSEPASEKQTTEVTETPETGGRSLKSLFSFFRLNGDKS